MSIDAPLRLHRETVKAEWIDYNEHMNLAYFMVAFDHATDEFFDFVGLDEGYRETTGCSPYLLETHVTYMGEMGEGEPMDFATQLLDYDHKRLHLFHFMYHAAHDSLVATTELIFMNIVRDARCAASFPSHVLARVGDVMNAHSRLARPAQVGRIIGIRGRPDIDARRQTRAPSPRNVT